MLPRSPNALANSPLDRAAHRRRDEAWLTEALAAPEAQLIPFHQRKPLVREEKEGLEAGWLNGGARAAIAGDDAPLIFLGVRGDAAYFAIEIPDAAPLEGVGTFEELRGAGARLSGDDIAILGCAKALFEWHARNGHCANCGSATRISEAGWKRECEACKGEHFPRVDPVVIMTPVFGDKVLLGRQRAWPKGMHSALAGFVELGETIEEAVARETLEEAGLVVTGVRLHSNQPWPFPHSLMIGAIATVRNDAATVDPHELESVRWFSRDEARLLLKNTHPDCFCPPPFAIAHQILKSWVEE